VHLLARAIRTAGYSDLASVRKALPTTSIAAPQGTVKIDPDNRHSYLTPRIGISNAAGGFDMLYEAAEPIKPDPYLINHDPKTQKTAQRRSFLRLVK
jgi:branched-chain amino acid transport system substrate-binding protein